MNSPSSSDPDASVEIRRILARRRRIAPSADKRKLAREAFLKDHTFIPYAAGRMVALQLPWFQADEENPAREGRAVRRKRTDPYVLDGSRRRTHRAKVSATLSTDEACEILRGQGVDQLRSGHPTLMALALSQMEGDEAGMCHEGRRRCIGGDAAGVSGHLDSSLWSGCARPEPVFDMEEWIHMEMLVEEDNHGHSTGQCPTIDALPAANTIGVAGWAACPLLRLTDSRSSTPGLSSGSSTSSQDSADMPEEAIAQAETMLEALW